MSKEPTYNPWIDMLIDDDYIQMTIDNHEEAHADDNMDIVAAIDDNLHEIKLILNKIESMGNAKASAASEVMIEAIEHVFDYIKD